jgi:hypothetical protein
MPDQIEKKKEYKGPPAVSASDFELYGCAHCGGIFLQTLRSVGSTDQLVCDYCHKTTFVVHGSYGCSALSVVDDGKEVFPKVVPHPRSAWPVDRPRLIIEREERIRLSQWLRFGYDCDVLPFRTDEHYEGPQALPIMAVFATGNGVVVKRLGNHANTHILAVELMPALSAALMYPISTTFGGYRFTMESHTAGKNAPVVDYSSACRDRLELGGFGATCEDGFMAAQVIRYLCELSKLDTGRIMDIWFGHVASDQRKQVDYKALLETLGLAFTQEGSNVTLTGLATDVIDEISVSFNANGPSIVWVKLAEGTILTSMPVPNVNRNRQAGPLRRNYTLSTPSGLDAALTALFFVKVLAPMIREMRQQF